MLDGANMKALFTCLALLLGQMKMLQGKPIVHLQPHRVAVEVEFGGKLLELIHPPAIIYLPKVPPKVDAQGNAWSIDIKDLGPSVVTILDGSQFRAQISVGQTVHIYSNGSAYSLK
jgi:hypothetical protein